MSAPAKFITRCLLIVALGLGAGGAWAQSDRDDPEVQRVEPFQVFDNLYYVGAEWVAAWLLVADQGLILFDSLYGDLTDLVIENIRTLGFDPNDIRYNIITHAHFDHIGGAKRFQDEFGAVTMMTEEDWRLSEGEPTFREYPRPRRHLSVAGGSTLNLGRTRLNFYVTPGHTTGVLSTMFTVYDNGYPHTAFMFGGAGLNFTGVDRLEMYIDSVSNIMNLPNVEVNIPNHAGSGDVFARAERLADREEGDPHPFVDPESFQAWLQQLKTMAEAQLAREQAAAN